MAVGFLVWIHCHCFCCLCWMCAQSIATENPLQMETARNERFYLACLLWDAPPLRLSRSYILQYDDYILFSFSFSFSFPFSFAVLKPRGGVGNQRLAHSTDNRATGSNNNNHFGQVQYPAKWLFAALQLVFFLTAFTENVCRVALQLCRCCW